MYTLAYLLAVEALSDELPISWVRATGKKIEYKAGEQLLDGEAPFVADECLRRFNLSQLLLGRPQQTERIKSVAALCLEQWIGDEISAANLEFSDQHYQLVVITRKGPKRYSFNSVKKASLLVAARCTRLGYSIQERRGEQILVQTPSKAVRTLGEHGCDCKQYQEQGKSRQPCMHMHLASTYTENRKLFRDYGIAAID